MPNRKKSNIYRKLPPVTRTTVAILDHVVSDGEAASGIGGSMRHGVDARVHRARAVEDLRVPRSVHQLAALAEVADVEAARRQALVREAPAVEVVGLAGARAVPPARAGGRRVRCRWCTVARREDDQQPGQAHRANLLLCGAAEHRDSHRDRPAWAILRT